MHRKTVGAHTVNDYVESIFGGLDHVTKTYRYIAVGNAASVTQQMRMHDFDRSPGIVHDRRKRKAPAAAGEEYRGGFFHSGLNDNLRESLVSFTRKERPNARTVDRADKAEHDSAKLEKREVSLLVYCSLYSCHFCRHPCPYSTEY